MFLGDGRDALEADGAILQALLVAQAGAIAGKADDVRIAVLRDDRSGLLEKLDDLVVVFDPVETAGDAAGNAADHSAQQAVFP